MTACPCRDVQLQWPASVHVYPQRRCGGRRWNQRGPRLLQSRPPEHSLLRQAHCRLQWKGEPCRHPNMVKELVSALLCKPHYSKHFSNTIRIIICIAHSIILQCGCKVMLTGQAWTNNMFVTLMKENSMDEDHFSDDKESLIPTTLPSVHEDSTPPPPQPLLLMFVHRGGADSARPPTRRGFEIGCIKANLVKKSAGDFSIDTQPSSNPFAKCFTFDFVKVRMYLDEGT